MASPLLSFVAGAGSGYLGSKRQAMLDGERQADREQKNQLFNAQMDAINREKKLNLSLADAGQPVAVNDGAATLDMGDGPKLYPDAGVANSDMRQARSMGMADVKSPTQTFTVGQKSYSDRATADAAAAQQNTPRAVTGRLSDAYSAAGQPLKGIELKRNEAKYAQEQNEFVQRAQQEGYAQTARAMLGGDAQQVFDTYNKQGQSKLKSVPTVERRELELPGFGTVPDYKYSGTVVDSNGVEQPFSTSSHDANMGLMPYKDKLDLLRKGTDSEASATFKGGLIDAKSAALQAQIEVSKLRSEKDAGGSSKEERLRYTSLFNESGRRMGDAQKALGALRKDILYSMAKPGSPQHQEMQDMQSNIKQLGEERGMYQSLLAGSQSGGRLAGPSSNSEMDMRRSVSGDMGANPAAIARELKQAQNDLGKVTDPSSRQQLGDYILNLQGQQASVMRLGDAQRPATAQPVPPQPLPKIGMTQGGYRFKGGNPADQKNWEKS